MRFKLLFILALIPPAATFPWTTNYVRTVADFYCRGRPMYAIGVIKEADVDEESHDHIINFMSERNKNLGHLDIMVNDYEPDDIPLFSKKPEFFIRVYFNCGCGRYYDTAFFPAEALYDTREAAMQNPFRTRIDISQCR